MPDAADPKSYLAGCAAILSEYSAEVMQALADPRTGTKCLKDYPSLPDIRKACEKIFEPIQRVWEREKAMRDYLLGLPAPRVKRTPEEQARIDGQVADWEAQRTRMLSDLPKQEDVA